MLGGRLLGGAVAAAAFLGQSAALPVHADTMEAALLRAYRNNPQLNAQRASVRATDEAVPQALSGYRPKAALTFSGGGQFVNQLADGSAGKKIEQGIEAPHAAVLWTTQLCAFDPLLNCVWLLSGRVRRWIT